MQLPARPSGHFRNIGTLPGENPVAQAEALTNRNQVVGDFGFTPNYALGINDRGQVPGYATVPTGFRNQAAFIYSNGRLIDIDRRPPTVERFSTGEAINNLGHVVGWSNHLGGFVYRGRKMESLNAPIDPKSGWNIQFPRAINDKGQSAADGVRGGVQYAVRPDPIRPSLEAAPTDNIDDEAGPIARSGLTAEQEAAEAKEVARPTGQ